MDVDRVCDSGISVGVAMEILFAVVMSCLNHVSGVLEHVIPRESLTKSDFI